MGREDFLKISLDGLRAVGNRGPHVGHREKNEALEKREGRWTQNKM